jgi:hypothetical protein
MRWRNLWRHSDPIGGPVASGPPHTGADATGSIAAADRRLIDPGYDIPPGDTSDPPVRGHSGFPADPVFQRTVAELAGTLPEPPPPPAGAAAGARGGARAGAGAEGGARAGAGAEGGAMGGTQGGASAEVGARSGAQGGTGPEDAAGPRPATRPR